MRESDTSTVCRCNKLFGEETLHPLASVIDLRKPCPVQPELLDCYAVLVGKRLPGGTDGSPCRCDYTDAVAAFAPPGERIMVEGTADGRLLLFHPDLLCMECLGGKMPQYTFFGYRDDEVLRLSRRELRQVEQCFDYIDEELHWGVDRFSCSLLCNKIELLLNYCLRFYTRQFTLRHDMSRDIIDDVTRRIDEYLRSGRAAAGGLPREELVSRWAGHSEAYTSDMLRIETGFATADYVAMRRMAVAKQMLIGTERPVGEISATLGFSCETGFRRLFTRFAGCTPTEYRRR